VRLSHQLLGTETFCDPDRCLSQDVGKGTQFVIIPTIDHHLGHGNLQKRRLHCRHRLSLGDKSTGPAQIDLDLYIFTRFLVMGVALLIVALILRLVF
jgi:hypothetical protein